VAAIGVDEIALRQALAALGAARVRCASRNHCGKNSLHRKNQSESK
jgi:hypothetical protein